MGFSAIPGNEPIKKILRLALEKGRVPNSLIFGGPEGVGKRRLAVVLAQALNCERETTDACGECPSCVRIAGEKKHPDVWQIEPATQYIKVDQMIELRHAAYVKPLMARRRVFIVDEAERMNEEAGNSLLKILEEPPRFTHIILVTSNPLRLLPTIRSRCRILRFSPIGRREIAAALEERGVLEERAKVIALFVNGNLEKALELDWDRIQEARREAWSVFAGLQQKGEASLLLRSYGFARREVAREDFERLLELLASFCRDASLLRAGGDPSLLLNPDYADELRGLESGWGPENYAKCLDLVEQTASGLNKNHNMSLLVASFYSLVGEACHG
jgi:DNA polymerase III subunit delta'